MPVSKITTLMETSVRDTYQANNKIYYLFQNSDPSDTCLIHIVFKFKNLIIEDQPGVSEGDSGNAECTIELSTEDWKAMTDKPGSAMQFFMQGKIKVTGNALLATKLQSVIG